jgi:hypothetical protein
MISLHNENIINIPKQDDLKLILGTDVNLKLILETDVKKYD